MNSISYLKDMMTKLVAGKAKIDVLERTVTSSGFKKREGGMHNTQNVNMPITKISPRAEKFKNERPGEWDSQMNAVDNGSVDVRGKYVLRPRLSWAGLYGKEPWPRERKQWEKI